jgi:hypothetical protein
MVVSPFSQDELAYDGCPVVQELKRINLPSKTFEED